MDPMGTVFNTLIQSFGLLLHGLSKMCRSWTVHIDSSTFEHRTDTKLSFGEGPLYTYLDILFFYTLNY